MGAGALAAGVMPVIVVADLGITVTGSAIAGVSIKVAGISALVGAGAGGAQVLSGVVKRDLVLEKLTEEESKTIISSGINNVAGSIMIGTSVYMLNNVYNEINDNQQGNDNSRFFYKNSRPKHKEETINQVWENAKDKETGNVYDPSGEIIIWDKSKSRFGQWDMGHIPGEKYSDVYKLYTDGVITKEEFLEWYNNPANYRPELPSTNRSHKYE